MLALAAAVAGTLWAIENLLLNREPPGAPAARPGGDAPTGRRPTAPSEAATLPELPTAPDPATGSVTGSAAASAAAYPPRVALGLAIAALQEAWARRDPEAISASAGRLRVLSAAEAGKADPRAAEVAAKAAAEADDSDRRLGALERPGFLPRRDLVPSGPAPSATGLAFGRDGRRLAVARFGRVEIWDAAAGTMLRAFETDPSPQSVAVSPDGRRVAFAGTGRRVSIWTAGDAGGAEGGRLAAFDTGVGRVLALAFSPDSATLAVAGSGSAQGPAVRLLDPSDGRERGLPSAGASASAGEWGRGDIVSLDFSPDGRRLALAGTAGAAVVDLSDGTRCEWPAERFGGKPFRAVAFRSDGRELTACGEDGSVRTLEPVPPRARRGDDGAVTVPGGRDCPFIFLGGPQWRDVAVEFDAMREAPAGFLRVQVRRDGDGPVVTFDLDRPDSGTHAVNCNGRNVIAEGGLASGRWHRVRITAAGDRYECSVDGRTVLTLDGPGGAPNGRVLLRPEMDGSAFRFRGVRVTAPDGTTLHEGLGLPADVFEPQARQPAYTSLSDPVAAHCDRPGRFLWALERGGGLRAFRAPRDLGFDRDGTLPGADLRATATCAAVAPGGQRIAVGLEGGRVRVIDVLPPACAAPAPAAGDRFLELIGANPLPLASALSGAVSVETDDGPDARPSLRFGGTVGRPRIGGWAYEFAAEPGDGRFRWVRFAWKGAGAKALRIRFAFDGEWEPAADRTADPAPSGWTVVTADLSAVLPAGRVRRLTGLSLEAVGGGAGLFGPLVIARGEGDLPRFPAAP
jgi:hypothetical protein